MDNSKQFFGDLDVFTQEHWNFIKQIFTESGLASTIFQFQSMIEVDQQFLDRYQLTSDIRFSIDKNTDQTVMQYWYKDHKIDPQAHYLQESSDNKVLTLTMLHEAISQDTNTPDIKHLQRPS